MKKLLCSAAALLLCGLLVFAAGCGGETEADRVRDMLEAGDAEGMREAMRRSTARRGLFDKK